MDVSLKQNRQMRSLSIAMGASIIAAAATMFVPVNVLESITGATGLSEIVGAAAAPLGDKARALIAFGAGALTLAAMTVMLLRKDAGPTNDDVEVVAPHNFKGFLGRACCAQGRCKIAALPFELIRFNGPPTN